MRYLWDKILSSISAKSLKDRMLMISSISSLFSFFSPVMSQILENRIKSSKKVFLVKPQIRQNGQKSRKNELLLCLKFVKIAKDHEKS